MHLSPQFLSPQFPENQGPCSYANICNCMQCFNAYGLPSLASATIEQVPDDGLIEVKCQNDHTNYIFVQQDKFELLSSLAVQSLADGYYRESIASFMAALERLYEYFIVVVSRMHGIDPEAFTTMWNAMSGKSERQFGAFLMAFLLEAKRAPALLPRRLTELRNAVIHKGKFPNRDEAISFGQGVVDCAIPILELLRSETYADIHDSLLRERVERANKPILAAGELVSNQFVPTILAISGDTNRDVVKAVDDAKAMLALGQMLPQIGEALARQPDLKERSGRPFN